MVTNIILYRDKYDHKLTNISVLHLCKHKKLKKMFILTFKKVSLWQRTLLKSTGDIVLD